MSIQAPPYSFRWLFVLTISYLMLVLTPVEVAEHYQHNVVYQDNLINFIKIHFLPLSQCPSICM